MISSENRLPPFPVPQFNTTFAAAPVVFHNSNATQSYLRFIFSNIESRWSAIEWALFLLNVIFSSTFLTIAIIVTIANNDLRHVVILFVTWVLWLLASTLFLAVRLFVGAYHFSCIIVDLTFFLLMKMISKASAAFHCAKTNLQYNSKERLLTDMEEAQTFEEWREAALSLDALTGAMEWRAANESFLYEWRALENHIERLKIARDKKDIPALLFLLRLCGCRDFCGISNPLLFSEAHSGTKHLIEKFIDEFCTCLTFICDAYVENDHIAIMEVPEQNGGNELKTSLRSTSALHSQESKAYDVQEISSRKKHKEFSLSQHLFNKKRKTKEPFSTGGENKKMSYKTKKEVTIDASTQTPRLLGFNYLAELGSEGVTPLRFFHEHYNAPVLQEALAQLKTNDDNLREYYPLFYKGISKTNEIEPNNIESGKLSSSAEIDLEAKNSLSLEDLDNGNHCLTSSSYSRNLSAIDSELGLDLSDAASTGFGSSTSNSNEDRKNSSINNIHHILRFLAALRLSVGRTALCLSGGGSLAMYHLGVVKALLQRNCLPRVISGTSGGSIVVGVLGIHTDDELMQEILKPDIVDRYNRRWFPPISSKVRRFFLKGQMLDGLEFQETCKAYFRNFTFREAFKRTGRLVSIVVTPASRPSGGEALILNCINSPDVLIWSAVAASCALPGLLPPHELIAKSPEGYLVLYSPSGLKWMDGSLTQDLPVRELASLFNVKQFIVSQVNPHHAPFVEAHRPGSRIMRALENWLILDIKHRYSKLARFNMIPRIFGQNISSFWMIQEFEGNITITPEASLIDWYRMINQPTLEDMHDFISKGEARTWPHLPRILHISKIEQVLSQNWMKLVCITSPFSSMFESKFPSTTRSWEFATSFCSPQRISETIVGPKQMKPSVTCRKKNELVQRDLKKNSSSLLLSSSSSSLNQEQYAPMDSYFNKIQEASVCNNNSELITKKANFPIINKKKLLKKRCVTKNSLLLLNA